MGGSRGNRQLNQKHWKHSYNNNDIAQSWLFKYLQHHRAPREFIWKHSLTKIKYITSKKNYRTESKGSNFLTCNVNNLSSNWTSFVRKSAPIVALYWLLNFWFTYLIAPIGGYQFQSLQLETKYQFKHKTKI